MIFNQQTFQNITATKITETSDAANFKRRSTIVHPTINNHKVSQELARTVKFSSAARAKPVFFAAPIDEQPMAPNGVPVVVEACLQYFNTRAMACEGLFRVPGNQRLVNQMWDYMQKHPYAGISTKSIPNFMLNHPEFTANEVASFLKRFIGSIIGGPVVTYVCYKPLLDLIEQKCPAHLIAGKIKCIIGQLLVPAHRALLGRLCNFLLDFSQHSHESRMDMSAIAVCFGFLISAPPEADHGIQKCRFKCGFRCKSARGTHKRTRAAKMNAQEQREYLMAQAKACKLHVLVIEAMIRHSKYIF